MSARIAEVGHAWDRQELAKLIEIMKHSRTAVAELQTIDGKNFVLYVGGVVIFTIEMHDQEEKEEGIVSLGGVPASAYRKAGLV